MYSSAVVKAPAKLNLALNITGIRDDGYHLMSMVMQAIDLCDIIELKKNDNGTIKISCDKSSLPCDSTNIAYRAAEAFFEYTGETNHGVTINITKNIPMQAGLGGGSADGAAVLVGLNHMYSAGLAQGELCKIGLPVGADIPFCINGGTALAEGIGEILTPMPLLPECHIVVAKPAAGINTAQAFKKYDSMGSKRSADINKIKDAVFAGDLRAVCANMYNVLQEVAELPEIDSLCKKISGYGALGAMMSGSGSAVFGIFDSKKNAKRCLTSLLGEVDSIFLAAPAGYGAQLVCNRKYISDDYISLEE